MLLKCYQKIPTTTLTENCIENWNLINSTHWANGAGIIFELFPFTQNAFTSRAHPTHNYHIEEANVYFNDFLFALF